MTVFLRILCLCLPLLIVFTLSTVALGAKDTDEKNKTFKPPTVVDTKVIDGDLSIIIKRNIFSASLDGKPLSKTNNRAKPRKIKKTSLKLDLYGTIVGDEQDARAIIYDAKEKKQDIYYIGDGVQGAVISAIEKDKVILEFDGKEEALSLKERKARTAPSTPVRKVTTRKPERTRNVRPARSVQRDSVSKKPVPKENIRKRPVVKVNH